MLDGFKKKLNREKVEELYNLTQDHQPTKEEIQEVLRPYIRSENEHHKIEGIFKALARSLKMAVKRDIYHFELPSSKGML